MSIIHIDPPYPHKGRLVSAWTRRDGVVIPEQIIPNAEPVSIDKLYDAINTSFILIAPANDSGAEI